MRNVTPPFVGLLVVVGLTISVLNYDRSSEPIYLSTTREAIEFFVSQGLHCHSGSSDGGEFRHNGFVSDRAITFEDTVPLGSRQKCGLTPEWKGIVWFAELQTEGSIDLLTGSIGGHKRVWGNIIVAGDVELLDRIEDLYRRR